MFFKINRNKTDFSHYPVNHVKRDKVALAISTLVMVGVSSFGIIGLLHSYKIISLPRKITPLFKDFSDAALWTMAIGGGVLSLALLIISFIKHKKAISHTEYTQIVTSSLKEYSEEEKFAAIMGTHMVTIFPNLFLANEAAVGLDNPDALSTLQSHHITHVLCCIPEAANGEDEKRRTHYYFPNDFTYARVPVGDAAKNAQEFLTLLPAAFAFIESARNQNKKVVVHCNAGNSRSPSVVIAYLMWKYKVSFEQAHNYINEKRWVQVDNFKSVLTPEHLHHL